MALWCFNVSEGGVFIGVIGTFAIASRIYCPPDTPKRRRSVLRFKRFYVVLQQWET